MNRRRMATAAASAAVHAAILIAALLLARGPRRQAVEEAGRERSSVRMVWLNLPGPGGGGGGGGNRHVEPPRPAELTGKAALSVPAARQAAPSRDQREPEPAPLNIPAKTLAASADSLPGAIDAP